MAFCKNWKFWSLCTSVRGNKHCRITLPDNGPIKITLRDCFCPYDAARYAQTDSKMNLDIALDEENVKLFEAIDEWVIDQLAQDPMQYFKQKLSRDEIKLMFKKSVRQHQKDDKVFSPTLRCKIVETGPYPTRCWNKNKEKIPHPEVWKNHTITANVTIKNLWFMSAQAGVLYAIEDCILEQQDDTCPF